MVRSSLYLSLLIFLSSSLSLQVRAQSIIDDLAAPIAEASSPSNLATETIKKVSASKRIFILTNSSNSFDKGDFISLVLNNELICRALVAKSIDGVAGTKMLRVYNPAVWNKLRAGTQVQVIRGDDSYFRMAKEKASAAASDSMIQDEDNLYDSTTVLSEDLDDDENKNRVIKPDNIVAFGLTQVEGLTVDRQSTRYNQFTGMWAYQMEDNIWAELAYGQSVINDFPNSGLDTKLTNLTLKLKYTVQAPFNSYLMPYIGYQSLNATSPGAGLPGDDSTVSEDELADEVELIEDLKQNRMIFGATILKRLVPGWFVRLDIGSDALGGGFALEF
jgi:hypothetical protein